MDFPILLLTGQENLVFIPKTMETTYNELIRLNPEQKGYELHIIPKYGHQDVLWGKKADKEIFPIFHRFLEKYGNGGVIVKDVDPVLTSSKTHHTQTENPYVQSQTVEEPDKPLQTSI